MNVSTLIVAYSSNGYNYPFRLNDVFYGIFMSKIFEILKYHL